MFCIHCGKNNPDIASFCFNCGSKLIKEEYKEESIETNVSVAKNDLIENASYEKEKRKGMEIYLYDIAMLEHGILKADEKVRTLRQKKISMSKCC